MRDGGDTGRESDGDDSDLGGFVQEHDHADGDLSDQDDVKAEKSARSLGSHSDSEAEEDDDTVDEDEDEERDDGIGLLDLEAEEEHENSGTDSDGFDDDSCDGYAPQSFPQFMLFPPEIRRMVWEEFCPDLRRKSSRVLEFEWQDFSQKSTSGRSTWESDTPRWNWSWRWVLEMQTAPARTLMAVHRESRAMGLHAFPDKFGFNQRRGGSIVCFDKHRDIILARRGRAITFDNGEAELAGKHPLANVKNLALERFDWAPFADSIAHSRISKHLDLRNVFLDAAPVTSTEFLAWGEDGCREYVLEFDELNEWGGLDTRAFVWSFPNPEQLDTSIRPESWGMMPYEDEEPTDWERVQEVFDSVCARNELPFKIMSRPMASFHGQANPNLLESLLNDDFRYFGELFEGSVDEDSEDEEDCDEDSSFINDGDELTYEPHTSTPPGLHSDDSGEESIDMDTMDAQDVGLDGSPAEPIDVDAKPEDGGVTGSPLPTRSSASEPIDLTGEDQDGGHPGPIDLTGDDQDGVHPAGEFSSLEPEGRPDSDSDAPPRRRARTARPSKRHACIIDLGDDDADDVDENNDVDDDDEPPRRRTRTAPRLNRGGDSSLGSRSPGESSTPRSRIIRRTVVLDDDDDDDDEGGEKEEKEEDEDSKNGEIPTDDESGDETKPRHVTLAERLRLHRQANPVPGDSEDDDDQNGRDQDHDNSDRSQSGSDELDGEDFDGFQDDDNGMEHDDDLDGQEEHSEAGMEEAVYEEGEPDDQDD